MCRGATWNLPPADLTTDSPSTHFPYTFSFHFARCEGLRPCLLTNPPHHPPNTSLHNHLLYRAPVSSKLVTNSSITRIIFIMAEQSINVPQVIVFAVVAFLIYRWYSSKPSAHGTRPAANRSVRINPAQIDTIAQMFPQLNRRDIAWDLQRNGGNAAATSERVLSGRTLDSVSTS